MKKLILTVLVFATVFFCSAQQKESEQRVAGESGKTINSNGIKPVGIDAMNWSKDPFDIKAFIENKGQFDKKDKDESTSSVEPSETGKINYAMVNKGAQFYFTSKGWTYRHDETRELTEEEIITEERSYASAVQDGDRDRERVPSKTISSFLQMSWEGANPDAQIVAESRVIPYFTYPDKNDKSGASCIKAFGYSKITYLNLYPGIDVEYTLPENKTGIKYALILHPGADLSVVKMHYDQASDLYIDVEGNIKIETDFGDFTDHAPVSYYKKGGAVQSAFQLSDNVVSFNVNNFKPSDTETLIIDPWTTDPGSIYAIYDAAYDLNYDNAGNIYVYGGSYPWQEIKFNSSGVIQWSYTAASFYNGGCTYSFFTSSSACYGDFAVDANSGSSYIVEGFNGGSGTHVIKLNSAGSQLAIYTPPNNNLSEMWRVQFNNCTKEAIIAGGGISQTYQACLLDTNVSNMTPVNVLNATSALHDFSLLSIDNYGNCFMATAEKLLNDGLFDNVLLKCPSSTLVPVSYMVSDNHSFIEVHSVSYVESATSQANGFNGMATDNNYVYTYDGSVLKKWNKSTGTFVSSVLSGGIMFASGGIDVSGCGDIFLAVGSFIYQVDSTYTTKAIYSAPGNVYDLALGAGNLLYACGLNFVGSVTLSTSSCGTLNLQPSITPDSCASKGTASVTATGGVGPYTYSWSPSGKTTQSINGLPSGNYTVTVTDLAFTPCSKITGGTQMLVVNVPSSAASITVSPSTSICNGKSTILTASGGTTYTWSPITGLSSGSGATVTANPTTTTTYTVTGSNALGCTGTNTVTVTVNPAPTITVSPASPSLCNGQSVSLTAGGATSYSWSSGVSGTTGATVSASPITTTTYTVTGTNASGCTNTKSVTVTVNPLPTIGVTPSSPSVCNGQSVSLSASGGISYNWSPSAGLSGTTGTPVSANPSSTTTYTVIGTDANGCTNTKSVTVTINPLPTLSINPTAPILCSGQSVLLTVGGATNYTWSPATGISGTTGATVSASPASTTTYTVTGTDVNGCTNTKSVVITINPPPAINVSPSSPSVCNGQSVSLSATGGSTYAWGPSSGLSATIGSTVSAGPGSTTTYTVTGTDANGCSNTKTVTVTVNPLPVITVNPTAPVICNGSFVSLTAGGGSTYVWSPSGGLSATTGSTVSANPSSTTAYTVTGTDGNGCSNTKSVTVTVNPPPAITVNPVSPILCSGQSVSLTAGGGTNYVWSPSTGLSATTGSTVSANPSSTTTYTVVGSDANGCSNTKSVTVTINPLPIVTVSPAAPALCMGQSVSLTAGGGSSYIWGPSTGLSATTGSTVSANPASTITYTVTGTDANGCTNTKSVTVTINPLPTITISPAAPILCNGSSVSLTAGGGTSYVWSPSSGLSATTGATVSANPSSTTTYTVIGTDANGCSNTKSLVVIINPLPAITISPVSPILCSGQSVSLTAGGGTTYVWSPSTGLSVTTGSTVSANPTTTTIYTVTGSDANGCSNTKSVTVTINPLPNITASPANSILCSGQSVSLTAGGGSTYVWSPSTGLSSTTGSTVSANPSSTSTYTITGTDANGCSNTKSATVTINPLPAITVSPNSPALCNGASVVLTAGGGSTYVWSPSTGLSSTTGSTVTAGPLSTSSYTVTGTDANGCTNTASVTVSVIQAPVVTVNPATPIICNGQSVALTAGGGNTYVWSPGIGLSATTGTTVTANPTTTTTYTVTGTIAGGCSASKTVIVTVNPLPTITASPSVPVICNGKSVSINASGGSTYVWSPTIGLSSGSGPMVSANPTSTTVYTVTGSDANGCTNTANVTVTVNPLPIITVSPASPSLCSGQSVNLTASGGATYVWTPTSGLSSGSGTTVSAGPSVNTTYSVTGTDANGCSNTASVIVTVHALPVITASPASPEICIGSAVSLTAGGGTSYSWTPVAGLSSGSGSPVSASPSASTIYIVTGTDANGCSNTASINVIVNLLPVITASPSAPVICNGQSISVTASGGVTYNWSPATGLSAVTGSVVLANPTITTNYTITGTDANGCSNTAALKVTVNPLPVIVASPSAPVLCNGQSVSLTAGGGTSYLWSPTTGLSSGSGSTVTADPITSTTYIVTGTDANGCSNTSSVTVTVNPKPVITTSPLTPSICNGQTVTLTAGGGTSYTWNPTTGLSSGSGSSVVGNPIITSTYIVTGTDGNGCSNTASITVIVNPLPVISVFPAVPAFCYGQSVNLNASGGSTYSWSPTSGLSSGTGVTVTANPTTTSSYTVTGTDGKGCSNTASVTVKVNPLPIVNAGPDANICPGASAQLNVTGPPAGSTYSWSPTTNLSCNNCSNPSANPGSTTRYIVMVTDSSGCSSSDTVNVIVSPLTAHAGPDTIVCSGNPVQLYASGGTDYLWSPSTGLSDSTASNPVASPLFVTTYTVTVSSGSCSATTTVTINIFPDVVTPHISQSGDSLFCSSDPGYKSYQWYFNSNSISGATQPIYVAQKSGNYNVAVTDTNGCSISVGINIIVNGVAFLPSNNTISLYPNPATNQLFIDGYGEAETPMVTIYDAIGQKVMEEKIKENNHTSVDVGNISAGVYFIEVQQKEGKWVGRFVKE